MRVDVVVGLQWGSEGKGKVVGLIAKDYDVAIRTGGPNAGHTLYAPVPHAEREMPFSKLVCHSVPCAFVNPDARLYIAAGAVIHPEKLEAEILQLERASGLDIRSRLMVDINAAVIHPDDAINEAGLAFIGSTLQGVGLATSRKIGRFDGPKAPTVGQLVKYTKNFPCRVGVVNEDIPPGSTILIEGTQGALLSLNHGTYPYVTSRDVTTAALLADAGLPPLALRRVYGVMRTYPIRVSGPSGPMGEETTWDHVAKTAGLTEVPNERTTVTGRTRRVAMLDFDTLRRASWMNSVTHLCVNFIDYLDGSIRETRPTHWSDLSSHHPVAAEQLARCASAAKAGLYVASYGPLPGDSLWMT